MWRKGGRQLHAGKRKSTVLGWVRSKHNEKREWLFRKDRVTAMKNKRESAMYGTLIIVVSTLTDRRFKYKIVNIVFEVSWRTQAMTRRLEIISDVGLFCRAWLFFSVHISADSCTLNLLYVISKLSCKIDQRELEYRNQVWVWVLSRQTLARVIRTGHLLHEA